MAWFNLSRALVLAGWTCLRRSKVVSLTPADSISVFSLSFTFPAASLELLCACLIREKAPDWHRDNKHRVFFYAVKSDCENKTLVSIRVSF